jgi:hypothetical protein
MSTNNLETNQAECNLKSVLEVYIGLRVYVGPLHI